MAQAASEPIQAGPDLSKFKWLAVAFLLLLLPIPNTGQHAVGTETVTMVEEIEQRPGEEPERVVLEMTKPVMSYPALKVKVLFDLAGAALLTYVLGGLLGSFERLERSRWMAIGIIVIGFIELLFDHREIIHRADVILVVTSLFPLRELLVLGLVWQGCGVVLELGKSVSNYKLRDSARRRRDAYLFFFLLYALQYSVFALAMQRGVLPPDLMEILIAVTLIFGLVMAGFIAHLMWKTAGGIEPEKGVLDEA